VVAIRLAFLSDAGSICNVKASLGCLLVHPRLDASREKSASRVFRRQYDHTSVFLVDRSTLPVPASPRDDYLTVQCTITIVKELPEVATTVPVPASDLHQHLGELFRSGTGSDVTFLVSGESFVAHRNILAARSPVLMAEFFGHMMETSALQVVIEDMEAAVFKAMLHFIYTDTVPELDQELDAVATMAQHLLAAADRYGLHRLKVICESGKSIAIPSVRHQMAMRRW
jgi:speckle-type POZ protein